MFLSVYVGISPTVKEGSEGEEKGCEREEKEADVGISPTGNKKQRSKKEHKEQIAVVGEL